MKNEILIIEVGSIPTQINEWLSSDLQQVFGLACRYGAPLRHPSFAYDARRRQYLADAILSRIDVGKSLCALAVADLDLYTPGLNFVFGLASSDDRRAIIALPRLRQSYYRLPEDTELFRQRVAKEAVHELGHVFGLRHCDDRRCVMFFSNSLADTDFKSRNFCSRCRSRLRP